MTLLAAVSQVKCAAATIILMPACQNASATKCCCQPRGLISLARVPLIITCHYQFWLHLLTRLSVPGRLCVCVSVCVCMSVGVSDSGVVRVHFGKRAQPSTNVKSRHKEFISTIDRCHLYITAYAPKLSPFLSVCKISSVFNALSTTARTLVLVVQTCQQSICTDALWKQRGAELRSVKLHCE